MARGTLAASGTSMKLNDILMGRAALAATRCLDSSWIRREGLRARLLRLSRHNFEGLAPKIMHSD